MRFVKQLLSFFLKPLGYKLELLNSGHTPSMDDWAHTEHAFNMVKENTMLSKIKLATLFEQAAYFEKNQIKGAFVECGVWKGGAVGVMALANLKYGSERRALHLFDSFDDICEPDPKIDGDIAVNDIKSLLNKENIQDLSGKLTPIKGVYDSRGGHGSIAECAKLIVDKIGYPSNHLFYHKGWFQDTLSTSKSEIEKIALLRLDADWYESTKVCLEELYDLVIPGGIVIIDDYGRYEGCKKAVDEFLESIGEKAFLHYSDPKNAECRYFFK